MKIYLALFILFLATPAAADDNIEDRYFSNPAASLTPQEMQGVAITKKWDGVNPANLKPVHGADGSVNFLFGATRPSIVCAVLQVCDIALQPGEQVYSVHIGDNARWSVEPAINGSGSNEIQHLIIKPMDVGLETSLVVTTDRRTYHMKLRSTRKEQMSFVTFTYPEEAAKKWDIIKSSNDNELRKNTIPETGEYIGDLSFKYRIDGDASWKPVRVYNDGKKTIIEMPSSMSQTEAPTLLVVDNDKGIFSSGTQTMVNYRLQSNRFIVDSIFNKAILISGVGENQNKITITKGE